MEGAAIAEQRPETGSKTAQTWTEEAVKWGRGSREQVENARKIEEAAVRVNVLSHVRQVPVKLHLLLLFSARVHVHVGSPCWCCCTQDNEAIM